MVKNVTASFSNNMKRMNTDKEPNNRVNSLAPFIDKDGILGIGGRLKDALISADYKYPVLLDSNHHFTRIIMEQIHLSTLHIGPQALPLPHPAVRFETCDCNGSGMLDD